MDKDWKTIEAEMPVTFVCSYCGSEDVLRDAWAAWSEENQAWELASTFDAAWCNSCEGEAKLETVYIPDQRRK
jgi:ribosomal protein L37AE/L43A